MDIFIGADHRGFTLKAKLVAWLASQGHTVHDVGAEQYREDDDFPQYAAAVARAVAEQREALGVAICGSGGGASIAANKIVGARAVVVQSPELAEYARREDDVNVLALAADFTTFADARAITRAFIATPFDPVERHVRRLEQVAALER
ncbi:MAG: RpiB/LacA/LacB family sugar-phosphate isomerase [bacterium]|nr:RpiB/LacA/LacB family sugar-phosphate isomerase [bacterium]